MRTLVRIFVDKAVSYCAEHDLEVEGHAPVFNIVDIVVDSLTYGSISAGAVDLGPAGKTGTNLMLYHVTGYLFLKLFHKLGALGSGPHQ